MSTAAPLSPSTSSSLQTEYFGRRVVFSDDEARNVLDDVALLETGRARVLLGEPGMGKSSLMRELARMLDVPLLTASRFIGHRDPTRLVTAGKPLLIDALDEAMARRDGDVIDAVLAQLEAAGAPPFILSCRSREWQSRGAHHIASLYGSAPVVAVLEPLSRDDADAFLAARHPTIHPATVLNHLDAHGLADLHSNPLTLSLMGRVAEHDRQLPPSRGALFDRVVRLIWPEHDDHRDDSALAQLSDDQALDAAGAIAAAMLLGGAEAVSVAGAAQRLDGDIRIAEIEGLPHGAAARTILASKLFYSVGTGRAAPIHKVIAEFLGARWLARQAATPRARRRVLAQLQRGGAVPASLRGLHAWLAYHSPAMAEIVIATDPYGVLRQGDAASLSPHQLHRLLSALETLAADDPFFRAHDWDGRSAAALMVPALAPTLAVLISSNDSNEHLRSLLIEGLEDTPITAQLAPELETVLRSSDRFYRERFHASRALFAARSLSWWRAIVAELTIEPSEDAPRLAREIIEMIGFDVSDELLVTTLFAEMGLTFCAVPRERQRRIHTIRSYRRLLLNIEISRLKSVIALVADFRALSARGRWETQNDIAGIMAGLLLRGFDAAIFAPSDAALLWDALSIFEDSERYHRDPREELATLLFNDDALRHAIQDHGLGQGRRGRTMWTATNRLGRRLVGLSIGSGDVVRVFNRLASMDKDDPSNREDWQNLVHFAHSPQGFDPATRTAAMAFLRGDRQLIAWLDRYEHPRAPRRQIHRERREAKQERKERARAAIQRREIAAQIPQFQAGDIDALANMAMAYLGYFDDLPSDLTPEERLEHWVGADIARHVLAGFEAVLHRTDLPSLSDIAEIAAAGSLQNRWFPVLAALVERMRAGREIVDIGREIGLSALLLCHFGLTDQAAQNVAALQDRLEAWLLDSADDRMAYARLRIEPSLNRRRDHVPDLHQLVHGDKLSAEAPRLAADWLARYPNLPLSVEMDLVDALLRAKAYPSLRIIAADRARATYRDWEHLTAWLAIELIIDFDRVAPLIDDIAQHDPDFLWTMRSRLLRRQQQNEADIPVAIAEWIVARCRDTWPHVSIDGGANPYNANDFLLAMVGRLSRDPSDAAATALANLAMAPADSYTTSIKHRAAEQRQLRAETGFVPIAPAALGALFNSGLPANSEDLNAIVVEELGVAALVLAGDDLDQVLDFWGDDGIPYGENRCRDRLAALIGPHLLAHGIQRITEADMPASKRADLAFASGTLQLPMEAKGQWHDDVWDAASGQLDTLYLSDWRSDNRGIYCVFWFGDLPASSNRRLKAPPAGVARPATAEEMRDALIERIPPPRRPLIEVIVLDLSAGRP